jgi:hypothetical protein
MGVYATFAIVLSMVYYIGQRKKMKLATENTDTLRCNRNPTNFHEEPSVCRPSMGKYYRPQRAFAMFPAVY